tara:strand:- start:2 stop:217 length:216 start_codon:yes stop_codon:yes gene_type:complete
MSEDEINIKLKTLEDKLDKLSEMVSQLNENINKLTNTCGRMDDHISFVEATYETLKNPLNFITNKVRYLTF